MQEISERNLTLDDVDKYLKNEYFLLKKKSAAFTAVSFVIFLIAAFGINYTTILTEAKKRIESEIGLEARKKLNELRKEAEQSFVKTKEMEEKAASLLDQLSRRTHEKIIAKEISIIGESGDVLISLGATDEGGSMRINDDQGRVRAEVVVQKTTGHAKYRIIDAYGVARASLYQGDNNVSGLRLATGQNDTRLTVGIDESSEPFLSLYGAGESRSVLALSHANGAPSVNLYDKSGQYRSGMYLNKNSFAGLEFSKDNASRMVIGNGENGRPSIDLKDKKGTTRISLWQENGSELNFYDKDGDYRAGVYVNKNEHAGVELKSGGVARLRLGVPYGSGGNPKILFFNKHGKYRMGLYEKTDGDAGIELSRGVSNKVSLRIEGPDDKTKQATIFRRSENGEIEYGVFKE